MALPAVFADSPRFSGNSPMLGSALFVAGCTILAATVVISAVRHVYSQTATSLKPIIDEKGSIPVVIQLASQKPDETYSLSKAINAFKKTITEPIRSFAERVSSSPSRRALGYAMTALMLFAALPPPVKTALFIVSKFAVLNLGAFLQPGLIVCGAAFQSLAALTMGVATTILMPILSISFVFVAGLFITIYALKALYHKFKDGIINMKDAVLNIPINMKNYAVEKSDAVLSQIPGYKFILSFFRSKEMTEAQKEAANKARLEAIEDENKRIRAEYDRDNEEFVARAIKEYDAYLAERKNFYRPPIYKGNPPLLVITEPKTEIRRDGLLYRKGSPLLHKSTEA